MIDTREELLIALRQAAELEHGLMAQYLFAAMTLKRSEADGLTSEQAGMVSRWRYVIMQVAREEMGHLGVVQNLLSALGGAPHFNTPSFPSATQFYHPPQLFSLDPLRVDVIERFVRFESPEPTAEKFIGLQPDPLRYKSVGDLYRQILEGIETLGNSRGFIGPAHHQDEAAWSDEVVVEATRTVAESRRAIERIVEEGEATSAPGPESHYAKFLAIRRDYGNERDRDPSFVPFRDVASNPSTIVDAVGRSYIERPESREVAALFNATYLTLLISLAQYYKFQEGVHSSGTDVRVALQQICIGLMTGVVRPLGEDVLPSLQLGAGAVRCGPCFETYSAPVVPSDRSVVWRVLGERTAAAHNAARRLVPVHAEVAAIANTLELLNMTIEDLT